MRNFLFVLASTATLTMKSPAIAQYVAPPPGIGVTPGYAPPGYRWREQRLNEEQRTSPDGTLYESYERQRTPNNTIGSGSIGVTDPNAVGGECAKGFSEETCRRRGQKYKRPR